MFDSVAQNQFAFYHQVELLKGSLAFAAKTNQDQAREDLGFCAERLEKTFQFYANTTVLQGGLQELRQLAREGEFIAGHTLTEDEAGPIQRLFDDIEVDILEKAKQQSIKLPSTVYIRKFAQDAQPT